MLITRFLTVTFSVGVMVSGAGVASGQDYPNRPIRIITANAGGGNDITARLIAQGISGPLGQQLVVDNRGGGMVTAEIVAKTPPDGYTVLVHSGSVWTGPLLRKTPYDPQTDLAPVTLVSIAAGVLVVHPAVTATSVKELIALAKAKAGQLNYASGPTGGGAHLGMELLKSMSGVNIVRVAYKGGGPALIGLIAGETQMTIDDPPVLMPNVKVGKLRALGVTSLQPSALYPELPTLAASGLPGFDAAQMSGVFVPAKTPAVIIRRLNQEIVRLLAQPEVKEKLFALSVEPVGSSPEQFAAIIKADMAKWSKVIKDAGITLD